MGRGQRQDHRETGNLQRNERYCWGNESRPSRYSERVKHVQIKNKNPTNQHITPKEVDAKNKFAKIDEELDEDSFQVLKSKILN